MTLSDKGFFLSTTSYSTSQLQRVSDIEQDKQCNRMNQQQIDKLTNWN